MLNFLFGFLAGGLSLVVFEIALIQDFFGDVRLFFDNVFSLL